MNKKILLFVVSMVFLTSFTLKAQNTVTKKDSVSTIKTYISGMNLRPVLLKKGEFLISLSADIPHYYKWYSPKTEKPEKLSSKMVINEAYFDGYLIYGLNKQVNLFLTVPVTDIHHYSPMGIATGVGFGDVRFGADLDIINLQKDGRNSLVGRVTMGVPTGHYKDLDISEYPTGLGSFRFQGNLTGLHQFSKFDMIYSAYYEYRTNHSGMHIGDETGAYLIFQKPFNTSAGRFGLETGAYTFWQFKNSKKGTVIPNTKNYAVDFYVGGWYNYLKNLYLRFSVPYSVYQNKAWFTKYQVKIQLDYLFK